MAAEPPYRFVARGISVGAASTDGDDVDPERPIAVACAPGALPRPAGHGRMIMRHALVRKPLPHEAPTIDLVMSYSKANTSPLLKRFLSRTDELVARVTRGVPQIFPMM
jgi:hypothetical protein